jgi:hypothetical protein
MKRPNSVLGYVAYATLGIVGSYILICLVAFMVGLIKALGVIYFGVDW